MIALYHGTIQFADTFNAFCGARVITNNIAQTDKMRASTLARVSQNRFERFEVSVNITQNCKTHYDTD